MKHSFLMVFAVAGLLAAIAPGLRADTNCDETQPPKPLKTSTVPYTVASLDKVTVKSGKATNSYQVEQDGSLDLEGDTITAAGLSTDELITRVRKHLADASSITVEEFHANRITILGEITRPAFAEISDGPMRVLDAIASASGFTPLANTRRVKLVRENAGSLEVYELDLRAVMRGCKSNQNILLKPGDVITVPRNFL